MYYAYIRKLQQDRYIGLCVVLNALMLVRIDGLFSLFENTIFYLATNGKLVRFNRRDDLVTSMENLYLNKEDIEPLTEFLRAGFSRLEHDCTSLPAVSYGTSKDSCKDFVVDDDQDEIIKSSYTNGYTFIYKFKGFNIAQFNSYKEGMIKLYKEKQELQRQLDDLKEEVFALKTILFIVLGIFILGLMVYS